jgi:hypothetical protein
MEPVQKRLKSICNRVRSMSCLNKILTLLLAAILSTCCLTLAQTSWAQSTSTPTVTEFSVQYVHDSYYIPIEVISSKDPYTGVITNTTTGGATIDNSSMVATIKNPPGATFYNFRWKGSYADDWQYFPFNPYDSRSRPYYLSDSGAVPFPVSKGSDYSELSLYFLPQQITANGSIDIQVQALYGSFRAEPYTHLIEACGPCYDFYFEGQASDWSSTQTISYNQLSPSSTPQVTDQPTGIDTAASATPSAPELPTVVVLPLFAIATITIALLKKRSGLVNKS